MNKLKEIWSRIVGVLNPAGDWVGLLPLRLILAYEFGSAGFKKLNGSNWFERVQDNFPFPFSVIPVEVSWFMATWAEILGGFALALGLFTRFWAFSLIIVTFVAICAVHLPDDWNTLGELWKSYAITRKDGFGNFRIPLIFIVMLLPLVLSGAGKLSIDNFLAKRLK